MTKADLWNTIPCCPVEMYKFYRRIVPSAIFAEKARYQSNDQELRLGKLRKAITAHATHF
jgi:hypothetical protein